MHRFRRLGIGIALAALAGCAGFSQGPAQPPGVTLPLRQAWVDGRRVDYVTTDVSDAGMARAGGANYVPRLADALAGRRGAARSVTERVYKFVGDGQISVFQSAPNPTGGANADTGYSPLWRVVRVHWRKPSQARELRSEEQILAAEERGELRLESTDIVANCPIVRSLDGLALPGVR